MKLKHVFSHISAKVAMLVTLCVFSFSSCENNACKEPMFSMMKISFYQRQKPQGAISFPQFTINPVKNGKLLAAIYDTIGLSAIELPLDPSDTISRFFIVSEVVRDTLVVYHNNTDEFVSAECGARTTSRLDSVFFWGGHFEDSISIVNPKVNGAFNVQNVKIYFD